MTAERLIYDASNFAAEIAPCGPEVLFGIGWAETAREIVEIERYVSELLPSMRLRCQHLKERLLLTIPGDNGEAMGPWQQWPIHFVDAWHCWERKKLDRIYQPNRATLNGQACEVACYLAMWWDEIDGVPIATYGEMAAAIHHYGGPGWRDKVNDYDQEEEWIDYSRRFTAGLDQYERISAELKGEG
jgi:hypothetical protein